VASKISAADSSLPNIVRPSYNDLRSADAVVDTDDAGNGDDGTDETKLTQVCPFTFCCAVISRCWLYMNMQLHI